MTVTFRATTEDDREALLAFSTSEPVAWIGPDRYRAESGTDNYRPGWSWLAERDGRPVARALWWGGADAEAPSTLDDLLVAPDVPEDERVAIAAGLITGATAAFGVVPEWIVDVAVDWHDDPDAVAAVSWRTAAARAAGLGRSTERVSVAWTPDHGVPMPSSLRFRSGDDDEFVDLFARVAVGSLDAHTVASVDELGPRGAAADDLEFYRSLPGSRDGWRIALDPGGLVVGFVLATRTAYDAAISFIGVLPQHRGRGVVDGLLAEGLRVHAEAGEPKVVGTTDAANTPMRRAFERAGFVVTKRRVVFER
ncbi:ribosomal protein S18 acetylase RimI-like enzyme [Curtobacterium sp. PhB142]|uniref:GNAT family N-acetyltransferase n=1 Tax=unclassified Curtobacterium TaxID=257496 RepID=UPI001048D987|nr:MULTISPECIES: GNAT family N-acetyltransferase [unclassified Curtobacterium]TCL86382.1 ribosomal protein S18 acetylase RimI-like enzyme [Curtobacterium sp. PhB142]TCM02572.1 ribosomal protein S18 acetylase RimI-like enzyme [Curtobacterium sp. PhB134]